MILEAEPGHHESLHLLGLIAQQQGDPAGAADLIARAIRLDPLAAHYRSNLATNLHALGRGDEAREALRVARVLRPRSAAIASNLGGLLTETRDWPQAISVLREAVALDPDLADAHYNLANALCASGAPEAALPVYARCLRLRPDSADTHFNLGCALARLGAVEAAADSYRRALRIDPRHAGAHANLGVLLHQADRIEAAAEAFATALALRPGDPDLACNLGAALLALGRGEAAAAVFAGVLARAPEHGTARFGHLMAHLPVVPRDAADVAAGRAAYAAELADLVARAERPGARAALAAAAFSHQPFFLAYQGEDDRALQRTYGALLCGLAAPPAPARPRRSGETLRVGLVSGFFCEHTIHTLFLRPWLEQFDRGRFRLFGFHTGSRRDDRTAAAAARCESFVWGARPDALWREAVLLEAPDVLLYPEIGMDPVAARLAAQRLAPVQCVAWGHPVTSGLPSIDAFLSSALMEPEGAAAHYTERLVTLPNLGIYCDEPPATADQRDRAAFGLRPESVVFWSGQNLAKYQPRHDDVFPRIAREVPGCQFVFIAFGRGADMTRRFRDRLDVAFARAGLAADAHCVILPPMPQAGFVASAALADVVLDPIGWSGGKSTLDILPVAPVIVTLAGRFLRARHTAAILERIGAAATVVETVEDYVAMAVRLGRSPALRAAARATVARQRHRVWRDLSAIRGLERVLEDLAPRPGR